jgi:Redoxin
MTSTGTRWIWDSGSGRGPSSSSSGPPGAPNCAELLPIVKAAAERYGGKVEFLGMNVTVNQTLNGVRRYLETEKPPYRPLWDEGGTSRKAYKVPGTSYVVIIDAKGRVVYTGFGGKQDFEEALKRAVG